MPGLFVLLSLVAFAAMAAMNATSKTPSPGAPLPGAPGADGDPPLGPAGPRLSSGKVSMPAGTKWLVDMTLNTPTTDRAAFEKFYASALAGQGKLLSLSWQDNQHLLASIFVLQPQTLDLDSTLHDLFTVNSVQQMNTQLTLPSVTPAANPSGGVISVPGTKFALHPGERWVLSFQIDMAPGKTLDRATFENGFRQEIGNAATISAMNWIGSNLQIALVMKAEDSMEIGKTMNANNFGATITLQSAGQIPGVI